MGTIIFKAMLVLVVLVIVFVLGIDLLGIAAYF